MDPFLKKLLLWGSFAYVVILCGVFVVCGYGARSRVEKLLDNSVNQIRKIWGQTLRVVTSASCQCPESSLCLSVPLCG